MSTPMSITTRRSTSHDEAKQFRKAFRDVLQKRISKSKKITDETTDLELCKLYEDLSFAIKRGIWPEVTKIMKRDGSWAAKHYLNSFKRAMYTQQFGKQQR